ncbi:MAG: HlyD family efflux transporter periplasmic adaptor subunit [Streptosporangiaceae bacterium]
MALRRILPPALSLVLTVVLLSGCSSDEGSPKVKLGPVTRSDVAEVVEAPATVAAKAAATVRSPADGSIKDLSVRDGDKVKDGQVLARIESPTAREQLAAAQDADRQAANGTAAPPRGVDISRFRAKSDKIARQGFKQARAQAKKIEDPKDRARALSEITKAEGEYNSAANAADVAVGNLNSGLGSLSQAMASIGAASRVQTRAAVRAAQRTVGALVIRAPFGGVASLGGPSGGSGSSLSGILPAQLQGIAGDASLPGAATDAAAVSRGAPISSGAAVVTVTDVSELRLSADVDESDILKIRRGVAADADFDALPEAAYKAAVFSIGVTPGPASTGGGVTYKVQLVLKGGELSDGSQAPTPKPGMSAVVELRVREVRNALSVPVTAIVTSGQDSTVWLNVNGTAERRKVRIGAEGDASVQILEGLKEGDQVVVAGADAVKPGQELT